MKMSQGPRVHQHPSLLGVLNSALLPDKFAAATLVVNASVVESNVDGVDCGVVVRPQEGLPFWPVLDHKHVGLQRLQLTKVFLSNCFSKLKLTIHHVENNLARKDKITNYKIRSCKQLFRLEPITNVCTAF